MDTRIKIFFEDHRQELLNDIAALVAVPSVKGQPEPNAPYGAGPRAALSAAEAIALSHGLRAEVRGDRVLVIELGEGEAELGILAHLDVVPPAGDWTVTKPYEMAERDGVIYGRGVIDDKGPAVASLYALLAARELGNIRGKVQLILGSDEENGSDDIAWYLKNYKMPPRVFTPDGAFPLVNTEKGKLDMLVTVPMPVTGLRVVKFEGGSVPNAVPDHAEVLLSDGTRLEEHGRASHGSLPDDGDNAIKKMIRRLAEIDGANFDVFRLLAGALPYEDNHGAAIGAACKDELSGDLTVNLGVISGGEGELSMKLDCRIPVCGDGREIAGKLQNALGSAAHVEVTGLLEPHHTPADSEFVQGLLKIYEDYTGKAGEALALGGLTYVHEVTGGVAFGCEFPDSEVHMHEPDERVPVSELLLAGEMFAQAILDFCG